MPLVSIILPVYNGESTIGRMIDSIISQSLSDWELIIVNDGSTDNTRRVVQNYVDLDNRIKLINKQNGGVASARQIGLEKAEGIYLINVDADDWTQPEMLKEMVEEATNNQSEIIISDYYVDNGSSIRLCNQNPTSLQGYEILKDIYNKKMIGSLSNKLIYRDLFKRANVNFEPGVDFCEDLLVVTKLILRLNPKISYLPKAFYHYVYTPGSLTNTLTLETLNKVKHFNEVALKEFEGLNYYNDLQKIFMIDEFMFAFRNKLYNTLQLRALALKLLKNAKDKLNFRWKIMCICSKFYLSRPALYSLNTYYLLSGYMRR